jgi:hypothetical protein
VPDAPETPPKPKASRIRVWQVADRILRSGRRPTVEGVRELLGGGSPNSVTAYINDWYRDLGTRLVAVETPLAGFPPEAVSLMTEFWRLAAADQTGVNEGTSEDDAAVRMLEVERDAREADTKALQTLNQELQRHRSTAEKSLAEARALLSRREAALEEERSRGASLEQALVQARMELEVLLERRRLGSGRIPSSSALRKPKRRKRPVTPRASTKRKQSATRLHAKQSVSAKSTPRRPLRRRAYKRRR